MYQFSESESIFVPDGSPAGEALPRTTALCIAAHPDDTEFMAYHAIATCFHKTDAWFTSCVVTDGAGSSRSGPYAAFTNGDMKEVRRAEQNKAATVGEYAAQIHLGYASSDIKEMANPTVTRSIARVIEACRPTAIYTHDLADTHDTHVSVVAHVISAIRSLDESLRPQRLYGMEVWRSMGWLENKNIFDASAHPNLAAALLGVHDSQIAGGKRYDAAVLGRRIANATFLEVLAKDRFDSAIYAMDLSELIHSKQSPVDFLAWYIDKFRHTALRRLERACGRP